MPREYRVGDRVEIIGNSNAHGFDIGEIVTLVRQDNHWAGNEAIAPNWLKEQDFKLVVPSPAVLAVSAVSAPPDDDEAAQKECCNCGGMFDKEDIYEHDGELYCNDCENECFICCEQCNDFHPTDDAINAGDMWYCSHRCAERAGFRRCIHCDEWDDAQDGYGTPNGDWACSVCYDDNYSSCNDCGDTFDCEDLRDGLCRDCRRSDTSIIKDYSYQPREFLFAKMPWENTIYLGIELEVECGDKDRSECAAKVMKWLEKHQVNDRVYIKEDSSLENGFELVFMPSTLQAIHKKFPMRLFLGYLKRIGLDSHKRGTCGLHVHISKSKMCDRALWAGKLFFYKCSPQILKFSAREDTNFCKFDNRLPVNGTKQENGRYSAFNTSATTNTVEIRVFRGTLQYGRFQASLQFSDLFAEYIQNVSIVSLKRGHPSTIWTDFLNYGKRKTRYQQFLKYCKAKGII